MVQHQLWAGGLVSSTRKASADGPDHHQTPVVKIMPDNLTCIANHISYDEFSPHKLFSKTIYKEMVNNITIYSMSRWFKRTGKYLYVTDKHHSKRHIFTF